VRPTIAEAFFENQIRFLIVSLSRNLILRCFNGTLAMTILKKDMRYIYHFAGIFSLFNFYNPFFAGKAYFASKLQNSAREKILNLGAFYRRKYWSYMKNALNKKKMRRMLLPTPFV
jgi:hypothetical protein